jgi:myo-inositol-1(or 4)-monophosphatase
LILSLYQLAPLHDKLCARLPAIVDKMFSREFDVQAKGSDGLDLVTSLDLALQHRLSRILPELLPGSRVLGEEDYRPGSDTGGLVWLVDPLDGTVNFVAGMPFYACCAVLLDEGRPILAAVYDIPRKRLYSAIAGGGAFIDGALLERGNHPARLAVLSSGLMKDLAANSPAVLAALLGQVKLRNFGSQSLHLCYAAAGYVTLVASREAKGWDDMAGALIAQEAGLRYGSYRPGRAPVEKDQYSLCCPPETFDENAAALEASLG